MKPVLIYCYDAWCGWCYGFSPVIKKIAHEFASQVEADVLSGGMILTEKPVHISATAGYIQQAYKNVEQTTGIKFGSDYLWHINNFEESDWYPSSLKPAIAMCIVKEFYPDRAIYFAADLQYALYYEGRDLTDDEAYRHLLDVYPIHPELFYERLKSDDYNEKALYEFEVVKQLQVSGFPAVLLQTAQQKFYQLASGYTNYTTLKTRLEATLNEVALLVKGS